MIYHSISDTFVERLDSKARSTDINIWISERLTCRYKRTISASWLYESAVEAPCTCFNLECKHSDCNDEVGTAEIGSFLTDRLWALIRRRWSGREDTNERNSKRLMKMAHDIPARMLSKVGTSPDS